MGQQGSTPVIPTVDPTVLAQNVLGPGITLVSASLIPASNDSDYVQSGTFLNGPQGFTDGAIFDTGDIIGSSESVSIWTWDWTQLDHGNEGHALCGADSYDAVVLSMEVSLDAGINGFSSEFVYTSEENELDDPYYQPGDEPFFDERATSGMYDPFAIAVDGVVVSNDDAGNRIDHLSPCFSGQNRLSVHADPTVRPIYHVTTRRLRKQTTVADVAGTHTLQIAICDGGDGHVNSALYVKIQGCEDCDDKMMVMNPAGDGVEPKECSYVPGDDTSSSSTNPSASETAPPSSSPSSSATLSSSSDSSVSVSLSAYPSASSGLVYPSSSGYYANSTAYPSYNKPTYPSASHTGSYPSATPYPSQPDFQTHTMTLPTTHTKCTDGRCYPAPTSKVITYTLTASTSTPCETKTVTQCPYGKSCTTKTITITHAPIATYPAYPAAAYRCPGSPQCKSQTGPSKLCLDDDCIVLPHDINPMTVRSPRKHTPVTKVHDDVAPMVDYTCPSSPQCEDLDVTVKVYPTSIAEGKLYSGEEKTRVASEAKAYPTEKAVYNTTTPPKMDDTPEMYTGAAAGGKRGFVAAAAMVGGVVAVVLAL